MSIERSLWGRAARGFTFSAFLGALLVTAVFLILLLRLQHAASLPTGHWHPTFVEGDTYWHMAAGQRILQTHRWPTTNYYSFTTPNSEWLAYEWLGEVLMALAWRLGGLRALMLLLFALASIIALLVYYSARVFSGNSIAAFAATALVLPFLASCFSVRPQLLGYIFLLLTLICLERYRRRDIDHLRVLPALFVLWVNTHGTFALGLIAAAIYLLSGLKTFRFGPFTATAWTAQRQRHLAVVFSSCLAALFVNPYGPRLLTYEYAISRQHVNLAYFGEWQPLVVHEFFGIWFLFLLLILIVGWFLLRRAVRLEIVGLIAVAAYLACRHQRFLVFFAIVAAPVLAEMLAPLLLAGITHQNRPAVNAALTTLFAAAIAALFPSSARLQSVVDRNQPHAAVVYMRTHSTPEPMFNDDFWGGYLIWSFRGERKVFIDGRSDAYEPSGVLADYVRIIQPTGDTLPMLSRYGVRSCLVERRGSLRDLLDAQPGWRCEYQDELCSLYVQIDPW